MHVFSVGGRRACVLCGGSLCMCMSSLWGDIVHVHVNFVGGHCACAWFSVGGGVVHVFSVRGRCACVLSVCWGRYCVHLFSMCVVDIWCTAYAWWTCNAPHRTALHCGEVLTPTHCMMLQEAWGQQGGGPREWGQQGGGPREWGQQEGEPRDWGQQGGGPRERGREKGVRGYWEQEETGTTGPTGPTGPTGATGVTGSGRVEGRSRGLRGSRPLAFLAATHLSRHGSRLGSLLRLGWGSRLGSSSHLHPGGMPALEAVPPPSQAPSHPPTHAHHDVSRFGSSRSPAHAACHPPNHAACRPLTHAACRPLTHTACRPLTHTACHPRN